jgi:hypothetical protein
MRAVTKLAAKSAALLVVFLVLLWKVFERTSFDIPIRYTFVILNVCTADISFDGDLHTTLYRLNESEVLWSFWIQLLWAVSVLLLELFIFAGKDYAGLLAYPQLCFKVLVHHPRHGEKIMFV